MTTCLRAKHLVGTTAASIALVALQNTGMASGTFSSDEERYLYHYPDPNYPCTGDHDLISADKHIGAVITSSNETARKKWRSYFRKSYLYSRSETTFPAIANSAPALPKWATPEEKWETAAFLIEYGVDSSIMPLERGSSTSNGPSLLDPRPWHGHLDYRRLAKSRDTLAHGRFHITYYPVNSGKNGEFLAGGIATDDTLTLFCPIFSSRRSSVSNTPYRASALVHEGEHARNARYGFDDSHGTCFDGAYACDPVNAHSRYTWADGELWFPNQTAYQTQYEFLCDVASHPNAWVPYGAVLLAEGHADELLWHNIEGTVLPECSNPYPMGKKSPEKPACSGGSCSCWTGMTLCSGQCVSLQANAQNCGACGRKCSGSCVNGTCTADDCVSCTISSPCSNGYFCSTSGCCEAIPVIQ